jgi:hypothetical protein
MPDAEAEQVFTAYQAHLAAFGPMVPDTARRLANEVSLHDGLHGVERTDGRLEVLVGAGDQQSQAADSPDPAEPAHSLSPT